MLAALRIKNLALVADLSLELQPGFNVITGETGAGKSVILGSIQLLIGQRADRTLIRTGADACSVEGVFELGGLCASVDSFLGEHGVEPCVERQLIIRRSFTAAGANRQFINGSPTTLATLGLLGERLVDLHGPHDHQSLLQPARQLDVVDALGSLQGSREHFAALVRRRLELEERKAALIQDEGTYASQLEMLRHQVREITDARLRPEEMSELETGHRRASNAARLAELVEAARQLVAGEEEGILSRVGALGRTLQEMVRLDPDAAGLVEVNEQANQMLGELQSGLSRYQDRIEVDPAALARLEERLNLLQSLKRKYGGSIGQVIAFGEDAGRRLASLESRQTDLATIDSELAGVRRDIASAGAALTSARAQLLPKLRDRVTRELTALGFKQSAFDVSMTPLAADAAGRSMSGLDAIEFLFAPNPGEPARPLRAIASSGEMARVMLAIKTVLAREDQVPVLVFDEVDANVGGETAVVVGRKLHALARSHQVLCITHLAPVAAQGDAHFLVEKNVRDGRTESRIRLLESADRIEELARMLGGASPAARRHAEELARR